jgi:hypothetical protein
MDLMAEGGFCHLLCIQGGACKRRLSKDAVLAGQGGSAGTSAGPQTTCMLQLEKHSSWTAGDVSCPFTSRGMNTERLKVGSVTFCICKVVLARFVSAMMLFLQEAVELPELQTTAHSSCQLSIDKTAELFPSCIEDRSGVNHQRWSDMRLYLAAVALCSAWRLQRAGVKR